MHDWFKELLYSPLLLDRMVEAGPLGKKSRPKFDPYEGHGRITRSIVGALGLTSRTPRETSQTPRSAVCGLGMCRHGQAGRARTPAK